MLIRLSELHQHPYVDEAAGEVVGHGIVVVVDVLYPVIRVDIVDAKDVEGVDAQPYVPEPAAHACAVVALLVVKEAVGHTYVHAAVGRLPRP